MQHDLVSQIDRRCCIYIFKAYYFVLQIILKLTFIFFYYSGSPVSVVPGLVPFSKCGLEEKKQKELKKNLTTKMDSFFMIDT